MHSFGDFLQDLSNNSGIKFNLYSIDGEKIFTGYPDIEDSNKHEFPITLENNKAFLSISKEFKTCDKILKYTIESKYSELFSIREQVFYNILESKSVSIDKIDKSFPFISEGCAIILINIDGNKSEALNIIRQLYNEQDVISIIYGDFIVIIGVLEDAMEHAESIKDSLTSNLFCKCYISISDTIYNSREIYKMYNDTVEYMVLGKKFGIKDKIFSSSGMLFEKIIYSVNDKVKEELNIKFADKFNLFDSEMINTIEEFVNCGLNISDAARKLYIHRNTLIYRLDKIHKDTGFDIRNFKEATVFIIAFLVWKEEN